MTDAGRTLVAELSGLHEGREVTLKGWIARKRIVGGKAFAILRDMSGEVQVVASRDSEHDAWRTLSELSVWSVVNIHGRVRRDPRAPSGVEVEAKDVIVVNPSERPLPLDPDRHVQDVAHRFNYRFLDLRNKQRQLVLKVVAKVAEYAREYLRSKGFVEIFSPKIVVQATEGGANTFPLIYFGREAYLAQSPQIYKQLMMLTGIERVFEIGPVFRAEPHRSSRHLCEFHGIDFEVSFVDSHLEVAMIAYELIKYIHERLGAELGSLLDEYFPGWRMAIPRGKPPVLTFREAVRVLKERGIPVGEDLDPRAEAFLGEYSLKEYGSDLVIVTDYPWDLRPFYTMRYENEPEYTKSFDLIMRGLEVASGGQREHRYAKLVSQIREKGLPLERFRSFVEFFRYGMPPHGGAGLGVERVVMKLLNLSNIREARLVPRDPERLEP